MDRHGRQKFFHGTSNAKETLAIARRHEDEERLIGLGHLAVPAEDYKGRSFRETADEYLEWGNAQGGRGGRPWGKGHARMRTSFLKFWETELGLKK